LADQQIRAHVEAVLGGVSWLPTQRAIDPDTLLYFGATFGNPVYLQSAYPTNLPSGAQQPFRLTDNVTGRTLAYEAYITSDALLDFLHVTPAGRASLNSRGAIFLDSGRSAPFDPTGNRITPELVLQGGTVNGSIPVADVAQTGHIFFDDFLIITPDSAKAMKLHVVGGPTYATASHTITRGQTQRLMSGDDYVRDAESLAFVALPPVDRTLGIDAGYPPGFDPGPRYRVLVSAGALLLVLLVIGFGMALFATEGRDEQQMLATIGASPSLLTRLAVWRAAIITTTGVVLGVPIGYLVAWLVASVGRSYTTDSAPFPWLVAALILFAVPVVVSVLGWVTGTIARRARPTAVVAGE